MQATKSAVGEFTPVSVTITFETQEELDLLYRTYVVTNVTTLSDAPPTHCRSLVNELIGCISREISESATPIGK